MNKPLLSICIQTYNRSHYLEKCLNSIAIQLRDNYDLKNQIEVVVADNASTDNTKVVVEKFDGKIPRLTYVRNKTNLGFDGNTNSAVQNSSGTYCWYFGDDDLIRPGTLEYIMPILTKGTYSIISTTSTPYTNPNVNLPKINVSSVEIHTSTDPNYSYQKDYYPSALSLLMFKKDEWLATVDFYNRTPSWFYFESILRMAIKSKLPTLHISTPLVYTGQDCRWADNGEGLRIFIDCNNFLAKMPKWGYDEKFVKQEIKNNQHKFIRVLLGAKGRDLPQTKEHWNLIKQYSNSLPIHIKFIAVAIFHTPNLFFVIAYKLKKLL